MNLIEGIQTKCNFIRDEIIPRYDEIGQSGAFGKIMLQGDIKKGEQAIAGGDVIEMLRVYKELESTCEHAL